MFKSKEHEVNSLLQRHDETGHFRFCQCYWITITDLLYPQRNYRTTRTHYITITRAANLSLTRVSALGYSNLFFNRFGNTHSIDRISGLVGRKAYYSSYTRFNSSCQHIVSSHYIRFYSFHWEKFATWNLLQSSGMENVVNTRHSVLTRLKTTHITNKKLYFMCYIRIFYLIFVAHIILFLLVT